MTQLLLQTRLSKTHAALDTLIKIYVIEHTILSQHLNIYTVIYVTDLQLLVHTLENSD
jgi:hypothetical protein